MLSSKYKIHDMDQLSGVLSFLSADRAKEQSDALNISLILILSKYIDDLNIVNESLHRALLDEAKLEAEIIRISGP